MAATSILPLAAEVGDELCRVKLQEGSLGGYRREILTEKLTEREVAIYKCPRCEGIMKDGSISDKGEQFCACCFKEGEEAHCDAPVRNTILSLKCCCPLSNRGCDWMGKLESVENHLSTCGRVYALCELMCDVVSTRDEMKIHVREECPQREVSCLHCSGVHKAFEMAGHVEVCEKVEVLCELGCGSLVRRENISCHRESECTEEMIACPYEKYWCRAKVKRRELKQHLKGNEIKHMELKLDEMEYQIERKLHILEGKIQILEFKLEIQDKEIDFFKEELNLNKVMFFEWSIVNILNYLEPNRETPNSSETFFLEGYSNFYLMHKTDALNFNLYVDIFMGDDHYSLEWPLRATFITRLICRTDRKRSMVIKSPIIEYLKEDCQRFWDNPNPRRIGSIPLCTDLRDFIRSNSLDLEVTLRILKNKY